MPFEAKPNSRTIKVSSNTPVTSLCGSIVSFIEAGNSIEIRAVGASAVNQMYKGIASARGIIASKGRDLYIKPGFDEITEENGGKKTVMVAHLVVQ
jgi:stage V sporulation protein SpoVS